MMKFWHFFMNSHLNLTNGQAIFNGICEQKMVRTPGYTRSVLFPAFLS